jgi:geranylgeranyl diphosphate synthase type II
LASDLAQVYDRNKAEIDRIIMEFLPEHHDVGEIELLYRMMRKYPERRGKGLRPNLCILTAEALGADANRAYITAAALEIFHNWILIHDDFEDKSDLRRGLPTLHREFGAALAINAGDALHGRMWQLLSKNFETLGKDDALAVQSEFVRTINETTEGQHMELSWVEQKKWDLQDEDYFLMCAKKTSWFTCITPFRLGGLIAKAPRKMLEEMIPLGEDLGIAFQIQDDILNLVGNKEKYGKEEAGDILEGKRTLILIHTLRECSAEDRASTLGIMNKERGEKTLEDVQTVLKMIHKYGSINYAESLARRFSNRAKDSFQNISANFTNRVATRFLEESVDFMTSRDW